MDEQFYISPTLATFLKVPFWTKMYEEEIVVKIWNYLIANKLFIDQRTIIVDKALKPVLHPSFYWKDNDSILEESVIMIFIAKMHLDPNFIQTDVKERLIRIKKNIAARKIINFIKKHRTGSKSPTGIRNNIGGGMWLRYLVDRYGHSHHNEDEQSTYDIE